MLKPFDALNLFLSKNSACDARTTAPFGLGAPSLRSMFAFMLALLIPFYGLERFLLSASRYKVLLLMPVKLQMSLIDLLTSC